MSSISEQNAGSSRRWSTAAAPGGGLDARIGDDAAVDASLSNGGIGAQHLG